MYQNRQRRYPPPGRVAAAMDSTPDRRDRGRYSRHKGRMPRIDKHIQRFERPHIKSIDTARRSGDEIHNEGITLKRWWHTLQQRQSCNSLSYEAAICTISSRERAHRALV